MAAEKTAAEDLAGKIRDLILGDDGLKSGDKLPGERKLAEQFGVARDTVRTALRRLESESLIQTVGTTRYVRRYELYEWRPDTFEHRQHRQDAPGTGKDAFVADVAASGRQASQEVDITVMQAPELVAERLQLDAGSTVVVRRRRRDVDGTPWQLADSYYPMFVAEGTPIMQPGDVTIPGGLMKAAGHEQVRFHDEITVRLPNDEECTRLQMASMTPVAQHVRTGYDAEDVPVRVIITIAPGDRHRIVYDVSA